MDLINWNQNKPVWRNYKLTYEKCEIQNYLIELQPDIAQEAFKVRSGMYKKIIQINTIVTFVQCAN